MGSSVEVKGGAARFLHFLNVQRRVLHKPPFLSGPQDTGWKSWFVSPLQAQKPGQGLKSKRKRTPPHVALLHPGKATLQMSKHLTPEEALAPVSRPAGHDQNSQGSRAGLILLLASCLVPLGPLLPPSPQLHNLLAIPVMQGRETGGLR